MEALNTTGTRLYFEKNRKVTCRYTYQGADKMERYDTAIIGAGAAGLFAAVIAARNGAKVVLIERNESPGKKLKITGKGRCNITNESSVEEVLDNIPNGKHFMQSAVRAFTPTDCIEFFEVLGVPLKTERGKRVFPESDRASDVVFALQQNALKYGVSILHSRATEIITENACIKGINTTTGQIECNSVILATGGLSYPATGSTGDGYKFAADLGHTITPLRGSLVPLEADVSICSKMQGLTLKNVKLSIYTNENKRVYEDFGELLFTHFGLSGPLVLSASAHMRDYLNDKYHALIDLKPALDDKKLDMRLLRDFEKYQNRDFGNALCDLFSKLCIPVIIEKSKIPPNTKVHSITREQRLNLCSLIKAFRIDIYGPRPVNEAIITSGGVSLLEINPKTMESKLVSGLYFAGEIIDVDAYTGGFNLQIAWSTAFSAATASSQRVKA